MKDPPPSLPLSSLSNKAVFSFFWLMLFVAAFKSFFSLAVDSASLSSSSVSHFEIKIGRLTVNARGMTFGWVGKFNWRGF